MISISIGAGERYPDCKDFTIDSNINMQNLFGYPNCTFAEPSELDNENCHLKANTVECKWDGGDCLEY